MCFWICLAISLGIWAHISSCICVTFTRHGHTTEARVQDNSRKVQNFPSQKSSPCPKDSGQRYCPFLGASTKLHHNGSRCKRGMRKWWRIWNWSIIKVLNVQTCRSLYPLEVVKDTLQIFYPYFLFFLLERCIGYTLIVCIWREKIYNIIFTT